MSIEKGDNRANRDVKFTSHRNALTIKETMVAFDKKKVIKK